MECVHPWQMVPESLTGHGHRARSFALGGPSSACDRSDRRTPQPKPSTGPMVGSGSTAATERGRCLRLRRHDGGCWPVMSGRTRIRRETGCRELPPSLPTATRRSGRGQGVRRTRGAKRRRATSVVVVRRKVREGMGEHCSPGHEARRTSETGALRHRRNEPNSRFRAEYSGPWACSWPIASIRGSHRLTSAITLGHQRGTCHRCQHRSEVRQRRP